AATISSPEWITIPPADPRNSAPKNRSLPQRITNIKLLRLLILPSLRLVRYRHHTFTPDPNSLVLAEPRPYIQGPQELNSIKYHLYLLISPIFIDLLNVLDTTKVDPKQKKELEKEIRFKSDPSSLPPSFVSLLRPCSLIIKM